MKASHRWYALAFLGLSLVLALIVAACAAAAPTPTPAKATPTKVAATPTKAPAATPTKAVATPTEAAEATPTTPPAAGPPDALHEFDAAHENCTMCHTVGASGVGEPGGTGLPDSHEGRTSDMCPTCHQPAS